MSDIISNLNSLTNDSNLTNGGTISNTEHNTHRTNYRTQINNLIDVVGSLESNYASTGEPTDTVEGKIYCDTNTDPAALKYYHQAGAGNLSTIIADHGDISTAAYTTNGVHLKVAAGTITDSSSSGTVAKNAVNAIGIPTLAASSATTYTENATLYIAGAPVDSTNVTTTTPYALWVDSGNVKFDGNLTVGGTATVTGGFTFDSDLDLNGNNIDDAGVIFLKEQAEADADVAGYGQLWVDTATPNVLMFTDDAGTDFTIAHNATTTLSSLVTVGALNSGSITSGFGAIDVGSSNIDGGTITADTALVGTLSTAAQTNITSVGTLTSLTTSGLVSARYGDYQNDGAVQVGADVGTNSTLTNVTRKYGAITVPHYTNAEEPLGLISGDSDSAISYVNIGTGASGFNAPMQIRFYAAGDTITPSGSEVLNLTTTTADFQALNLTTTGTITGGTLDGTSLDIDGTANEVASILSTNAGQTTLRLETAPATPATNDFFYLDFRHKNSVGTQAALNAIISRATSITSGAETGQLEFWTYSGSIQKRLEIGATGNFDFQSGNLTTTGTLSSGNYTLTGTSVTYGAGGNVNVTANTSDGADNVYFAINGGGGGAANRGAYVVVAGNEHSSIPGDLILNSGATGDIYFRGDTDNTLMFIDGTNKNVGIGTTAPVQQSGTGLHIHNPDAGQTRLKLTTTWSGATANDGFDIIAETSTDINLLNHEAGTLKLGTSDTNRLTISATGNFDFQSGNLTTTGTGTFGGTLTIGTAGATHGFINSADNIYLNIDSNNDDAAAVFEIASGRTTGSGGNVILSMTDATANFQSTAITTTGTLGAGVASLTGLGVTGTSSLAVNLTSAGNTQSHIDFIATSTQDLRIGNNGSSAGTLISGASANSGVISKKGTGPLHIGTNGTIACTIDSSQQVGIGTASPDTTLHVVGATDYKQIKLTDTDTDSTTQRLGIVGQNWDSDAVDTTILSLFSNSTTNADLVFGGGDGNHNAATSIAFYTAANNTTTTGTLALTITSSQELATGGETAPDVDSGGLCLNQGANDGNIFTCKSSDVGHPMTGVAEADTYLEVLKVEAAAGGAVLRAFKDADGIASSALVMEGVLGEAADTTDTSSSRCVVEMGGYVTDGGTGRTTVAATGNLFGVYNGPGTPLRFLLKGNGDCHLTNTTLTALDDEDDIALVEATRHATAKKLKHKVDKKTMKKLSEIGVLSSEGDFQIMQGVNALNMGAIGQIWNMLRHLASKAGVSEDELKTMAKQYA